MFLSGHEQLGCVFSVPGPSEGSAAALGDADTARPGQQPSRGRRAEPVHAV